MEIQGDEIWLSASDLNKTMMGMNEAEDPEFAAYFYPLYEHAGPVIFNDDDIPRFDNDHLGVVRIPYSRKIVELFQVAIARGTEYMENGTAPPGEMKLSIFSGPNSPAVVKKAIRQTRKNRKNHLRVVE